jgi:hypothetical protein
MNFRRCLQGIFLVGVVAVPAIAAENQSKGNRAQDCLDSRRLDDWKVLDDRNLVVWSQLKREAYLMTFATPLSGLNFETRLVFVDGSRDRSLCGSTVDSVRVLDPAFPQEAFIKTMVKLDDAAISQLEAQYKVELARDAHKKQIPKKPEPAAAQ